MWSTHCANRMILGYCFVKKWTFCSICKAFIEKKFHARLTEEVGCASIKVFLLFKCCQSSVLAYLEHFAL